MKFTQEHDSGFDGVLGWEVRDGVLHKTYFGYTASSTIIVDSSGVTMYEYRDTIGIYYWYIDKPLTIAEASVLVSLYEKMEDTDLVAMIKLTASYEAI